MPEIVIYHGEMRCFILQGYTPETSDTQYEGALFRRTPQGRQPVQMLDQHHLEQHHGVYARPPIILTIQRLHHFIQPVEIHRLIDLSQQMILWD